MKRLFLLSISLFAISCTSPPTSQEVIEYDYCDVDKHIEWSDIFDQPESIYHVYFYSLMCGHCKEIKQEILSYYFSSFVTMYFVDVTNKESIFSKPYDVIGVNSIDSFYIFGTPFLIKIENSTVIECYAGVNQILNFINLNAG